MRSLLAGLIICTMILVSLNSVAGVKRIQPVNINDSFDRLSSSSGAVSNSNEPQSTATSKVAKSDIQITKVVDKNSNKIMSKPQECSNGKALCEGKCVDLRKDQNNCGACGNICDRQHVCMNGNCRTKQGKFIDSNKSVNNTNTTAKMTMSQNMTNLSAIKPQSLIGNITPLRTGINGIATAGISGTAAKYACEGLLCTCKGDEDCNDMFTHGGCGDVAQCSEEGCWCFKKL